MIRKQKNEFPKMKIPGEIFTKHIQFGTPDINGVYAIFYKPNPPLAHDNFPMSGLKIANYSKGSWGCSEQVLAFIGPLPVLSLDELEINKECVSKCFAVGSLKDAASGKFKSSNHPQYILAALQGSLMKKGNFIFELNSHKNMPIPLSKFDEKRNNWVSIKNPEIYLKTIKLLKR